MRCSVYSLSCFVMVCSTYSKVSADPDYYQALDRAQAATKGKDFASAARVIENALRKYPRDYALTLRLAYLQFRLHMYAEAERNYHLASALSDGSIDARVGLGWTLIDQARCEEALVLMRDVLAEDKDEPRAQAAIETCLDRDRIHGSVWAGLGGFKYQGHAWKDLSGAASLGLRLLPVRELQLAATYRFLTLTTLDARVPSFNQHEAYLEGGYTSAELDLSAHAAVIWSGDEVVGGSRHGGLSGRFKYLHDSIGDVFVELTASYYHDLWVGRFAASWDLSIGPITLSPGVAVEQFAHETLGSGSLMLALTVDTLSVWVNGKAGTEYRAAYLSQFAVFNAEERSPWAVSAGARWRADEHWSVFGGYSLIRLSTADGLQSGLHIVNVGTSYTL